MNRFLCAVCLALLIGGAVRGDPPPGVKAIRLVLHSAVPPSPVLRYPLLPDLRDRKSGNGDSAVPRSRQATFEIHS